MDWHQDADQWVKKNLRTNLVTEEFRVDPFRITSRQGWKNTVHWFKEGLQLAPLISIDTERNLNKPQDLRAVLIGTVNGYSWLFGIKELRRNGHDNNGLEGLLPPALLDVLANESIIKVGSGLLEDLKTDWKPYDTTMTGVLECQYLMHTSQQRRKVFPIDPEPTRTGLGHASLLLFGVDYKPLRNSEKKAAEKSGEKPPWYKTHRLYKWPLSLWSFHPHQLCYLGNDAKIPLALVLTWVTEIAPFKHCGTLQSALHLLQETHQQLNQQSDDLLEITMELESMFGVIPNQNPSLPDEDIDWDLQEQELNNLLTPENPAPIENWTRLEEEFDHLTKTEKMDSSVQASPTSLTKETTISVKTRKKHKERCPRAFMVTVTWGRACLACASPNHVQAKCPSLQTSHVHLCAYPQCGNSRPHVIKGCVTLHSRCNKCLCRGHMSSQCDDNTAQQWFEMFHKYASHGRYTQRLFHDAAWGFWPWQDSRTNNTTVPLCAQQVYLPKMNFVQTQSRVLQALSKTEETPKRLSREIAY